jgi:hypothetical protein
MGKYLKFFPKQRPGNRKKFNLISSLFVMEKFILKSTKVDGILVLFLAQWQGCPLYEYFTKT